MKKKNKTTDKRNPLGKIFRAMPFIGTFLLFTGSSLCARNHNIPNAPASHRPFVFTENKGQITDQNQQARKDIDYVLQSPDLSIFIGATGIQYQFRRLDSISNKASKEAPASAFLFHTAGSIQAALKANLPAKGTTHYTLYRMDVALIGANLSAKVVTEDKQHYYEHYYLSSSGEKDIAVQSFKKVTYKNIYPDIDWVLYIKDNSLEYDFIIHPGGKLSDIRLKYDGASAVHINEDGSLTATTPLGSVSEQAPYSFQADGKKVASRFVLADNLLRFQTDPYEGTLTLDPGLKWCTYYGGSLSIGTQGNSVCTEKNGDHDIYITGGTDCVDKIATTGAHQTTLAGGADAYLAKFTPDGQLEWGTYFGGSEDDRAYSVAADQFGHIYITGTTSSSGLATPGAFQPSFRTIQYNPANNFLACFDNTGKLSWSTYCSTVAGDDDKTYVSTCSDGSVYLAGTTRDTTTHGISTPGAYDEYTTAPYGYLNYWSFIVKFDSAGSRLWGTYFYGGSKPGGTVGWTLTEGGIAVDQDDNVYITGSVNSGTHFKFTGTHQDSFGGGSYDVYLGKFNAAGKFQWGTFFGASGEDRASSGAICVDQDNNVYIGGLTTSLDSIATPNTSRPTSSGTGGLFAVDNYLAKFSSDGQQIWGTYVGPVTGSVGITGIASDNCDNVYITGGTFGEDIMTTPDAFLDSFYMIPPIPIALNSYLIRYDGYDGTLQYSSYYGDRRQDTTTYPPLTFFGPVSQITGLTSDPLGNIYLTGFTSSDTGMATPGAYQTTNYGAIDNIFLTKFLEVGVDGSFTDTAVCIGGTFSLPYLASGAYNSGNIFSVELADSTDSFSYDNPVIIGRDTATASGFISCTVPPGTIPGVYRIRMRASDPNVVGSCWRNILVRTHGDSVYITTNGFTLGTTGSYVSYQWFLNGKAIPGATDSTYDVTENGNYSVVTVEANGCIDSSGVYKVTNYTGTTDLQAGKYINVYPNPTKEMIYITAPVSVNVQITNLEGKVLKQLNHVTSVSLNGLASGMYLLHITNEAGHSLKVEKLIKL